MKSDPRTKPPRSRAYEIAVHQGPQAGRRFIVYAAGKLGALRKLMGAGLLQEGDVTLLPVALPPPHLEKHAPIIDNRRAPGS